MKSSAVFKEVMKEYANIRLNNSKEQKARKEDVYNLIPRVREIDRELMTIGFEITKQILNDSSSGYSPETSDRLINDLQYKSKMLIEEKKNLVLNKGFDKDYLEDIYNCEKCKDAGFIETKRCRCLNQRIINKYYEISNLSNTIKHENFDTFDLNYYSDEIDENAGISPKDNMKKIYHNCLNFVSNLGANNESGYDNLYLYGETALGKTFLCNCIAKELIEKGVNVIYTTSSQLFKLVENIRFSNNDIEGMSEEYYDIVFTSDVLIIDDLGTEFSTSVTVTELFNIINTRFLSKKPIIISTNLSPSDLEGRYSDRITSRILGNYKLLKFIGEDIRLKKRYGL